MVIGDYKIIDLGNDRVEIIHAGKSEIMSFSEFMSRYKWLAKEASNRLALEVQTHEHTTDRRG